MADYSKSLFDLTPEDKQGALNMGLLQAGLGILARNTDRANPMPAIGAGGLMGIHGYQEQLDRAQKQKLLEIEKARLVRAEETYRRQQEALKTAPPEIQRAVSLGASIEDFYKPQKLGEGESLTVPAFSMGAPSPADGASDARQYSPAMAQQFGLPEQAPMQPRTAPVTAGMFPGGVIAQGGAKRSEFDRLVDKYMTLPQGSPKAAFYKGKLDKETEPGELTLTQAMDKLKALPAGNPDAPVLKEFIAKKTSHPMPPNVSVKVDTKLGESFAKDIAPMVGESRAAALGAIKTAGIAQRVNAAISSGNVNLGPGATIRNYTDQFAQIIGAGGKSTEERLVNTRNVMRGLAQSAVAARGSLKGQGQVSDYEGKLIQRAEAGEIQDFTVPELRDFVGLSDRLARQAHAEHQRMLGIMRAHPDKATQSLVPFYDVPQMPPEPSVPGKIQRLGP